jgi:MoaA/NifB/PqqE/SkfB family radical SAM enzyme
MTKKFQKIHIEISNICNLQCSFCPPVERDKKIMAVADFKAVLAQVAPITEEVTLHLMGEPLGHPQFEEILAACSEFKCPVNLVTNGTLLKKKAAALFQPIVRQINFSLHSFTDNFPDSDPKAYLQEIISFSREIRKLQPEIYINYRLWNLQLPAAQLEKNKIMLGILADEFQLKLDSVPDVRQKKGVRLAEKIILHFDTEFRWPSLLWLVSSFWHKCKCLCGTHSTPQTVFNQYACFGVIV